MKRTTWSATWGVLALLLLLMAAPAFAGTSHFYMPIQMFRKVAGGATCAMTTTADASYQNVSGSNSYQWVFSTPVSATNCSVIADFWFPSTNTGNTLTPTIHHIDGAATNNKYCYKAGFAFAGNLVVGSTAYASVAQPIGSQALQTASITGANGLYTDQTGAPSAVTGFKVTGNGAGSACSGDCANLQGWMYLERCECGVDSGCGSATDAGGVSLVSGVDVAWTSP